MPTRLIGTDSDDPWLPDVVSVHAVAAKVADVAGNFTSLDVEGALAELADQIDVMGGAGGGLVSASDAETIAGTSTTKAVTPAGLKYERPYFDVRSYGAVGDGTTDDTTAVNAAIAAAAGGTVYFPKGTYKIAPSGTGLLANPIAGTTFAGESPADTTILLAPTTATARSGVTVGVDDITIQNLTIRRASTFDSIMFELTAGVDRFTLRDCLLDGGDDAYPTGYTHGISIPASGTLTRIRAERCRFTNFHFAWLQTNTSTATVTDIQFRDCEFSGWVGEALAFNAPVGVNRDVVVDGCRFVNIGTGGGNGLSLAHVENARLTNNYFNFAEEAIHVEDYSRDVVIAGNTIYECGGPGATLEIVDSAYITVDGNLFRNTNATTYAKVIEALGSTSGTTVGGRNRLDATYAITLSDNVIYAGPNTGIATIHVAQAAVVGNTIIGGLAISSTFVETGTNTLNGIYIQPSTQLGGRIAANSIRGFRYGIGPANLNTLTMQPGMTIAANSITECRYGIVANNTKTASYTGNIIHRCVWPFTTSPTGAAASGGGNDPHVIVGNMFQGNQYPAAFDGVLPVVANGTATVGSGVTLTTQPLIGDIIATGRVITFSGGGVLTTTGGVIAAGATAVTGTLTVANVAAGEIGYVVGGVDIPYTTPFNVRNRTVSANTDSVALLDGVSRVGFYTTRPIAKQTGVAVTAAGIHAALINLGLIT